MDKVFLDDVTYVHAAAQDCKPASTIPPMYRVGDTVLVERKDNDSIRVELQIADEVAGYFEGRVVETTAENLCVGTEVTFDYR